MAGQKAGIRITGMNEALRNLSALGSAGTQGLAQLLYTFGQTKIETPAKIKYVPVVTGNLRSTITTQPPEIRGTRVAVIVSAGGPAAKYARAVHENPRAGRTGGLSPQGKRYYPRPGLPVPYSKVGQWKYLETPAVEAAKNSKAWLLDEAAIIMETIRRRLRT